MTIAVHTLGCKVNQCDADTLISMIKKLGHNAFSTREFNQSADIYVINTCTVTHVSDKKSRQMLRRARKQNPNALVAMCGCMAKNSPKIEGVDFVFDARIPDDFLLRIKEISTDREKNIICDDGLGKTRSFIKIQDGCDRFCSYCIVPYVRGGIISREPAEILSKAKELIESGALEIVLTGIQVASYGYDTGKTSLSSIIKEIAALDGLKRLRLSSIDPWAVSEDFLDAVAESPTLCSHFHLSLQSGCDATLEKMNRRYATAEYAKAACCLRKIRPETALTTDVIVGFPGESDSDFEKCLSFVRKMEFAKVHVFEFSPREGTPAAEFSGQVPHKIKSERGKVMRELAAELQNNFLQNQIGKTLDVLFEKRLKPQADFVGNSENYCSVKVNSESNLINTIKKVNITACEGEILTGITN